MYIAPNSTIRLLSGVPIDKNQSDTLWFASVGSQTSYFVGKTVATITEATYQRLNRGYCRLGIPADQIYGVNYMMFQNTSFGSKWFYAFVDKVEYINNEVSEIRFTIDPIQTWFFDYTLNQCFIERETPRTDEIGGNILPEPVGLSEYVMNGVYERVGDAYNEHCVIIQWIDPDHTSGRTGGGVYNGVFAGCKFYAFDPINDSSGLNTFLTSQAVYQAPDSVIGLYMCPKCLVSATALQPSDNISDHLIGTGDTNIAYLDTKTAIAKTTVLDGYLPRNAKCYTYPFTYYHVDNGGGQGLTCRYEFFDSLTPKFRTSGNSTFPVEITLFPIDYKNVPTATTTDPMEYRPEKLSIKGYPECSFSIDAYTAWSAQNSVPILMKGAANVFQGALAGAEGGLAGAGLGALGGVAQTAMGAFADWYSASIASDITKGSFATGSNDVANHRTCFKGGCVTQPSTVMKTIDQFFDAFGYTKREWGTVSRRNRTRWTYIKTIGANVDGSVPADDAKYIADCYDRGIRFWADTTNPCDYSTANGFLS